METWAFKICLLEDVSWITNRATFGHATTLYMAVNSLGVL